MSLKAGAPFLGKVIASMAGVKLHITSDTRLLGAMEPLPVTSVLYGRVGVRR
jgi:hypothetical protein